MIEAPSAHLKNSSEEIHMLRHRANHRFQWSRGWPPAAAGAGLSWGLAARPLDVPIAFIGPIASTPWRPVQLSRKEDAYGEDD